MDKVTGYVTGVNGNLVSASFSGSLMPSISVRTGLLIAPMMQLPTPLSHAARVMLARAMPVSVFRSPGMLVSCTTATVHDHQTHGLTIGPAGGQAHGLDDVVHHILRNRFLLEAAIGAAADKIFVMTYEWGYTYGPPMAVAPINSVRRVLDYAVSEIPAGKIFMGMPNYAYDWILPYKKGETRATLISNEAAAETALQYGAEIKFDEEAQTPYFNYTADGNVHEVWFEDARSIFRKLSLVPEYGLHGGLYWNLNRENPQNTAVLSGVMRYDT